MTKTIILISHTHWDRQWYRTVQEFRLELVKMMDSLLELLKDDPDFKVFHLDGQTAIVEDYLDFRPENRETIMQLVRAGRLKIGPWYLQPDNFIVSGEGLMRNLLKGTTYAREMGEYSFSGWLPDSFGHPAQMPQVLTNFGIDSFIFSRGLGDHLEKEAIEFLWESPHKDRVIAIFQRGGYYGGGNLAYPFFWGDIQVIEPDHRLAVQKLRELIKKSEEWSFTETIPIWNGSDHMSPERSLSETIRYADSQISDYHITHGSIEEYVKNARNSIGKLQTVTGELRGGRYEAILASVLSSRMHIKQSNYRLERSLERETEPLLALADVLGDAYPKYALDDAWDALLKNHFHDAICGCSIDQAHREMEFNFAKTEQTVNSLSHDGLKHIATVLNQGKVDSSYKNSVTLLLFNSLPQARRVTASTYIDVPSWEGDCIARDGSGKAVPVQILDKEIINDLWIPFEASASHIIREIPWWQEYLRYIEQRSIVDFSIDASSANPLLTLKCGNTALEASNIIDSIIEEMRRFPDDTVFKTHTYFLRLHLLIPSLLPAYGYTSVRLAAPEKELRNNESFKAVQGGEFFLENQFIRVEVNEKGEVDLLHKESEKIFPDIHKFQDQADRGDTYDFCPVSSENEENTILQPEAVKTLLLERGPVRACIGVYYSFETPKGLDPEDRDLRSHEKLSIEVESKIFVSWEKPFVEFETTVHNNVKDHRLRMYAKAPFRTEVAYSDGQFYIQKRDIEGKPGKDWAVPPAQVFPHERWVALSNGKRGLAVFAEGLPEHSIIPAERGTYIGLTLLRCVGWLSRQDNKTRPGQGGPPIPTPDAQCQGSYTFRYGVFPFDGEFEAGTIVETSQQFDARPLAKQLRPDSNAALPSLSLFELTPHSLQVTALKKSEDGKYLCLRFYNPDEKPLRAGLKGDLQVKRVWKARADETIIEELPLEGDSPIDLRLHIDGAEIVTLLIDR